MVYLPKQERSVPALVVELKWDQPAEGAIAQIKKKRVCGLGERVYLRNLTGRGEL